MFKKLFAIIAIITIAFVFAGCSSAEKVKPNGTLQGTWSDKSETGETELVAIVTDDNIEVTLKGLDGDFLIWKGTFEGSDAAKDGTAVSSKADSAANAGSLLGMEAGYVLFVYDGYTLSFNLEVLGQKKTVHLQRRSG